MYVYIMALIDKISYLYVLKYIHIYTECTECTYICGIRSIVQTLQFILIKRNEHERFKWPFSGGQQYMVCYRARGKFNLAR